MPFSRTIVLAIAVLLVAACGDSAGNGRDTVTLGGSTADPRHELPMGTAIDATIQDSITSHRNNVGDHVRAIVSRNVVDDSGRTVIAAGATVKLRVAALHHASGKAADAIVTLDVLSIADGTTTYEPSASTGRVGFALRAGKTPSDDRELVVTAGTPVTIRLTNALGFAAK